MTELLEHAPSRTEAGQRVDAWLAAFQDALTARDPERAAALFLPQSFWRDLVSFTWNLSTAEHPAGIAELLRATLEQTDPTGFATSEEPVEAGGVTEAWLTFETAVGRGEAHLRLRDDEDGTTKAWTLLTSLQELKGYEEPLHDRRPRGAEHGATKERSTWLEGREKEAADLGRSTQPYVVIVGGGQGGIALGARLRQLGVPTIIVEKNARPGDSWRNRYKSLCLHDPVWYDHLPYLDFPKNWPVFAPKDKLADWLEMYTQVMELTYWGSSTAKSASYDETKGEWTLVVDRDGEQITLRPQQLVLATGMSGKASVPAFEGMDVFEGDQHHSSQHPGPDAYRGKRAVVIGDRKSVV